MVRSMRRKRTSGTRHEVAPPRRKRAQAPASQPAEPAMSLETAATVARASSGLALMMIDKEIRTYEGLIYQLGRQIAAKQAVKANMLRLLGQQVAAGTHPNQVAAEARLMTDMATGDESQLAPADYEYPQAPVRSVQG